MCAADHRKEGVGLSIPRFMRSLMALLVCVALIRAVNGAGPLSVSDILVDFQQFDFDMQHIADLISLFNEGVLSDSLYEWNYNLDGISGFFINIGKSLSSFFSMIGLLVKTVVFALWDVILSVIDLLLQLLSLVCEVLGFNFAV